MDNFIYNFFKSQLSLCIGLVIIFGGMSASVHGNQLDDCKLLNTYHNGHKLYLNESNNSEINVHIRNGLEDYNQSKTGTDYYDHCTIAIVSSSGAVIAGAVAVICTSEMLGNIGMLQNMWVDESYRNQGLGTKIIHALVDYAQSKDCFLIQVEAWEAQGYAKNFFEKLGFAVVATIPNPATVYGREGYVMRKACSRVQDQLLDDVDVDLTAIDIADIVDVDADVVGNGYQLIMQESWSQEYSKIIEDKLDAYNGSCMGVIVDDSYTLFVTSPSGEIMAGVIGHLPEFHALGKCCMVNTVWVSEQYRNQGWGTVIMRELVRYAVKKQCFFMQLETYEWQAKGFYEKCGFTPVATVRNSDGCRGMEQYYMRKFL